MPTAGKPTQFKKNPAWNIFYVYDEAPRAQQATREMKALCNRFVADFKRTSIKYQKEGLDDSESRDTIIRYVVESMEPVRKTIRLRREHEMMSNTNSKRNQP
jgi:hypothetical protein